MSAAPHIAAPSHPPGPPQDRPSDSLAPVPAPIPARIVRVLALVRWIIGYGTELVATLHQRAAHPDFTGWAMRYRQGDLAIIAARIKRGLLLAAGLEAHLASRVAQGRDLPSVPLSSPSQHSQRTKTEKAKRAPRRTNIIDLPLDRLPTAEEIAEELRRRPVGAVLVDICRDLGIRECDLPPELRRVLRDAITFEGGNLVTLLFKEDKDHLKDVMRDPAHPWHQMIIPPMPRGFAAARMAATTGPPTGPP